MLGLRAHLHNEGIRMNNSSVAWGVQEEDEEKGRSFLFEA